MGRKGRKVMPVEDSKWVKGSVLPGPGESSFLLTIQDDLCDLFDFIAFHDYLYFPYFAAQWK